jgi:hypothetical protein
MADLIGRQLFDNASYALSQWFTDDGLREITARLNKELRQRVRSARRDRKHNATFQRIAAE